MAAGTGGAAEGGAGGESGQGGAGTAGEGGMGGQPVAGDGGSGGADTDGQAGSGGEPVAGAAGAGAGGIAGGGGDGGTAGTGGASGGAGAGGDPVAGAAGTGGTAGAGGSDPLPECTASKDCSDGDACTVDACQDGTCSHAPLNPSTYDDGDACTKDLCNPAIGAEHIPTWQPDDNPCTLDACDPLTGQVTRPTASDCWYTPTSNASGLAKREDFYAQWLGDKMIVWGGSSGGKGFLDGALYDPTAEQWTPISKAFAEFGGYANGQSFVSDGRLIIFPAERYNAKGEFVGLQNQTVIFNPTTFSWTFGAGQGHPASTAALTDHGFLALDGFQGSYEFHGWHFDSVDDDSKATPIKWPGETSEFAITPAGGEVYIYGGRLVVGQRPGGVRYNLLTRTFTDLKPENPPGIPYRRNYTATWTGDRYLIWGGQRADELIDVGDNSGSVYNPATDTWTEITKEGAPSPRAWPRSQWLGDRWLVWGGALSSGGFLWDGAIYTPATNTWKPVTKAGAPPPLSRGYAMVWTGEYFIFWGSTGGNNGTTHLAYYYP